MVRPQITVNITGAVPVAGAPVDTGALFFLYAGTSGPAVPTTVKSVAEAITANVPAPTAALIGDALTQGAPKVIVLRAAAVDAANVTQPEWAAALALLTPSYGPGQVATPGVATSAAYQALLAHVNTYPARVALLDIAANATASGAATAIAAIAASAGSSHAAVVGPWVTFADSTGTTHSTPGSIVAAGLAARGDAAVGTSNNSPIFDQGRGAGTVKNAIGLSTVYSDADADTLFDAGVNIIRPWNGVYALTGWRSISTVALWHGFGVGRLAMQLTSGITALMGQYLGAQIDGKGHLFAAIGGAISGYLLDVYNDNGLFGDTPADAFTVTCDSTNNTPTTIAAGAIHAAVSIKASSSAEQITIDVVTSLAA